MMQMNRLFVALLGSMLFLMSCDRTEDISISKKEDFTLECAKSAWSQDRHEVVDDKGIGCFEEGGRFDVRTKAREGIDRAWVKSQGGRGSPSLKRVNKRQGTLSF